MCCLNLVHTVEYRIARMYRTRVPAMSCRRTCKYMPSNLAEQELAITITRNGETHPFEIESAEESQVHVFFIVRFSIVLP
jgi:hypothetical protein